MNRSRSRLVLGLAFLLLFALPGGALLAADGPRPPDQTSPAGVDQRAVLQQALTAIEKQTLLVEDLQQQLEQSDGFARKLLDARLDKALLRTMTLSVDLAEKVLAAKDDAAVFTEYTPRVTETLKALTSVAITLIERLREQIVMPEADQSAAVQAAAYSRAFTTLDSLNRVYDLYLQSLQLARQFGVDVTNQELTLRETMAERAANGSVLLEMATADVVALRASIAAVPADEELKAKLAVAASSVNEFAANLKAVIAMMETLALETAPYREQVLKSTGEISTEVFDVGVGTSLLVGWGQTLWNVIIEDGPDLVFKLFLFLLLLYLFKKLADFVQKLIEAGLEKSSLQLSELLRRMTISIVRNVVIVVGFLIAMSQLGISLGPLLAGLGVIGFVIGFALQDSLSNFASGLMILIYRPYDVGDLIEAAGVYGKVSHMSLVNTTIMTLDNQAIVMPNNKIWGDVIKNVTAQNIRRVDMTFGISYSDDIEKTERVLQEILDAHDKVLAEPVSMVRLHELADSSVNFIVRPWVNSADYWDVYWDVTRTVKMRFDAEGISIPFPQRDVHLYAQSAAPQVEQPT